MTLKGVERKVHMRSLVISKNPSEALALLHQTTRDLVEAHNYHDDQLNQALRGGVSASNNSKLKFVTLSVQMPIEPPWRLSSYQNGWGDYGVGFDSLRYLMEPGGNVSIVGLVTGGAPDYSPGGTGVICTLPVGYAPLNELGWATEGGNDGGIGQLGLLRVTVGGDVMGIYSAAVVPYFFLNPMRWIAAAPAAAPHAFIAPWPIMVQHGFKQCRGLSIEACREDTQAVHTTCGAPYADWADVGQGQLRLNGLWGLAWGKKYIVRLRLSAEG